MFERRSLRLPITLGVVMFVALLVLAVGWVLVNTYWAWIDKNSAGVYWALLSVGAALLTLLIVGTAIYLTLTIKAINLSRRQSNFIDSVTHELKSPIASLKLYLQTLNRRHLSPAEQEGFYRDMLEDVERLDRLINHLLDAARLEKDRVSPPPGDVPLDDVLRAVSGEVVLRYHAAPETVRLDIEPCVVRADRVDLELIFRNLIDNAVKYADDDDPQVKVSLRPAEGGRVVANVSDNGPGIPLHQRRRVFGRFARLGSELERKKPGTGLGLYIARTLATRLGGSIQMRDGEQGRGTTFQVLLPGRAGSPADNDSGSRSRA